MADIRGLSPRERKLVQVRSLSPATGEYMNKKELKILAKFMHNHTCGRDHVEHCAWDYEFDREGKDLWDRRTHKDWFKRAERIAAKMTGAKRITIIRDIDLYDNIHKELIADNVLG